MQQYKQYKNQQHKTYHSSYVLLLGVISVLADEFVPVDGVSLVLPAAAGGGGRGLSDHPRPHLRGAAGDANLRARACVGGKTTTRLRRDEIRLRRAVVRQFIS